jgi:hypothetical protein
LAFHNSPYIAGNEAADVFKNTQEGQSNAESWLNEMEDNIGIGRNSPVVMTIGDTFENALSQHLSARLATGDGLDLDLDQYDTAFVFEFIDNGCSDKCGNCPATPSSSRPTAPSFSPILNLSRPARSATNVRDRASSLSEIMLGRPLSSAEFDDLERGASSGVNEDPSTSFLGQPIRQHPELHFKYNPITDSLSITDSTNAQEAGRALLARRNSDPTIPQARIIAAERAGLDVIGLLKEKHLISGDLSITLSRRVVGTGILGDGIVDEAVSEVRLRATPEIEGGRLLDAWASVAVSPTGEIVQLSLRGLEVDVVEYATVLITYDDAKVALLSEIESKHSIDDISVSIEDSAFGYMLPRGIDQSLVSPQYLFSFSTSRDLGGDVVPLSRKRLAGVDTSSGTVQFFE